MGHSTIDPFRRLATNIRGRLKQAYCTGRRWLGVGIRAAWAVVCYIFAAFVNVIDQAKANPYVAIAGLAAIIYTGYAALQWRAIRGQVRVMRDQVQLMKAELRPDIELTNVGQPIFQLKGPNDMGQVQWDYEFQNVGKGIADKSSNVRYMKVGNTPYKLSYGMNISAVQQTSMGINEKSKGTVYFPTHPEGHLRSNEKLG